MSTHTARNAGKGNCNRPDEEQPRAATADSAPVGVVHVCLGDGPGQRRHTRVHRRGEGAGVDVVLQQQHLRNHGNRHSSNFPPQLQREAGPGAVDSSSVEVNNVVMSESGFGKPNLEDLVQVWRAMSSSPSTAEGVGTALPHQVHCLPLSPSRGRRWDPRCGCSARKGTWSLAPSRPLPPLCACPSACRTAGTKGWSSRGHLGEEKKGCQSKSSAASSAALQVGNAPCRAMPFAGEGAC
jgi:hypothetical protein